jgi:hypothetical protein
MTLTSTPRPDEGSTDNDDCTTGCGRSGCRGSVPIGKTCGDPEVACGGFMAEPPGPFGAISHGR